MILAFTVPGDPVPAQMGRIGIGGKILVSGRVKGYRDKVRLHTRMHVQKQDWQRGDASARYAVTLRCFVEDNRVIDCDNLAKCILDGIKREAFHDDRQVVDLHVFKRVDRERPRVEIEVMACSDLDLPFPHVTSSPPCV
jgi:Holliday junction resolvase RusA-like endonuclease